MKEIIKKNYLLFLVLLPAFIIRVMGVYPGYPQIHPDEGTSYHTAVYLLYHWFRPDRFDYPAGVPFIHALIYVNVFIPIMVQKILIANPFGTIELLINPVRFFTENKDAIFGKVEINAMYWTRYISATFGALAVWMLYLTAKRLFNKETGLFAAFFLAFNFRHVLGSHFGLPDVHSSFFSMLSLFASVLLFEKNTKKRYIYAGITAGLTFSLKYQPFAFLPFFVAHIIWAFRKKSIWYLFHPNMIFGGLCIIATFLAINPYYLFNIGEAMFKNNQDYRRYQMGIAFFRGYPLFYLFHWGIGKLPFITICIGIVAMLFARPLKFLLPFSFAFAVMFFMTYYSNGGIYPRNFVGVMPFLMIFAGFAIYVLYSALKKFLNKQASIIAIAVIVISINLSSIKNSFILSYEYSKPWTVVALSEWIEKNIPSNVFIRNYLLFLPYKTVAALGEKNVKQLEWTYGRGPNSLAEFQEEGTNFSIINSYIYQSGVYDWRQFPDPKMYLKYDNIPFDYLENSFYGLAVKELMQYTVFEAYKPWQAQETSNYIVFKIPSKSRVIGNKIKDFTFNVKDLWKLRGNFGHGSISLEWIENEGKDNKGAIKLIKNAGVMMSSRFGSPPISIQAGKMYTIQGWIKNSPPLADYYDARDGFLRMDFYKGDSAEELERIGAGVAISGRADVTTNGKWIKVQASMPAPKDARYLTISFQAKDANYYSLYLDDVELYETDEIPNEPYKNIPYIKSTIPKDSIYFNSFL